MYKLKYCASAHHASWQKFFGNEALDREYVTAEDAVRAIQTAIRKRNYWPTGIFEEDAEVPLVIVQRDPYLLAAQILPEVTRIWPDDEWAGSLVVVV